MKKTGWLIVILFLIFTGQLHSSDRFPRPEFESGYEIPEFIMKDSPAVFFAYLDLGSMILFLALAVFLVLKVRKRIFIFALMTVSVIWFGFIRRGCICPVGSTQNILSGLFLPSYTVPLFVIGLFFIPLAVSAYSGRVFCGGVCPLGGLQDLLLIRPLKIPYSLNRVLSILPVIMLGITVLFVIHEAGFIVCRLDPFVTVFRLSPSPKRLVFSAFFVIASLFIGRPFCRTLCPYGVLLGVFSLFSKRHLSIAPAECVNCGQCAGSCPVQAIRIPASRNREREKRNIRQMAVLILILPVFILSGGLFGYALGGPLSFFHPDLRLASLIVQEEKAGVTQRSIETAAFFGANDNPAPIFEKAHQLQRRFKWSSMLVFSLIFTVIWLQILSLTRIARTKFHEPDPYLCVCCGRCIEKCPVERDARKKNKENT